MSHHSLVLRARDSKGYAQTIQLQLESEPPCLEMKHDWQQVNSEYSNGLLHSNDLCRRCGMHLHAVIVLDDTNDKLFTYWMP